MNKDFFKTNYSKVITKDPNKSTIQKDGYAYAISKRNGTAMLVLDDVKFNKSGVLKDNWSSFYNYVDSMPRAEVVDFLNKDIMSKIDGIVMGEYKDIYYYNSFPYDIRENNGINTDRISTELYEVSDEEAINLLRRVFYYLRPRLGGNTVAGGGVQDSITDPNYYTGHYYLRNGEMYTIIKYRDDLYMFKGYEKYTTIMSLKRDMSDILLLKNLLKHEKVNFDLYKKSCKLYDLKRYVVVKCNDMIDYGIGEMQDVLCEINKLDLELKNVLLVKIGKI